MVESVFLKLISPEHNLESKWLLHPLYNVSNNKLLLETDNVEIDSWLTIFYKTIRESNSPVCFFDIKTENHTYLDCLVVDKNQKSVFFAKEM